MENKKHNNSNIIRIVMIIIITSKKNSLAQTLLCFFFDVWILPHSIKTYTHRHMLYIFKSWIVVIKMERKKSKCKAFIYCSPFECLSKCVDQKDGNFTYENIMRWHFVFSMLTLCVYGIQYTYT